MKELIDKSAVIAEIERLISNGQTELKESEERKDYESYVALAERIATCINVLSFLDTLEVKEVDLEKERMNECPYRQVGCAMYEGKILECNGACGWIVDYLNLKEFKQRKGE